MVGRLARRALRLGLVFLLRLVLGMLAHAAYVGAFRPVPAQALPAASELQADLIAAVRKVSPAVVSIRTNRGLGSGVVYNPSGLVLTNAHVVSGARTVSVGLADGRRFQARILGADSGFDLAVLKVDAADPPVAPRGIRRSFRWGSLWPPLATPTAWTTPSPSGLSLPSTGPCPAPTPATPNP